MASLSAIYKEWMHSDTTHHLDLDPSNEKVENKMLSQIAHEMNIQMPEYFGEMLLKQMAKKMATMDQLLESRRKKMMMPSASNNVPLIVPLIEEPKVPRMGNEASSSTHGININPSDLANMKSLNFGTMKSLKFGTLRRSGIHLGPKKENPL
jgi:hypothetical protein